MNIRREQHGLESVAFIGPIVIALRGKKVQAILSGEVVFEGDAENFEEAVDGVLEKLRKEILSN